MKALILVLLTTILFAKTHDFGIHGQTYPILENDFQKEILEEAKKLKFNKEEIKEKIVEQVKAAAQKTTELPLCLKDEFLYPEIDYAIVPENVFNPVGRLIYTKGQKIESKIPAGRTLDLCFIDGRNKIVTKNQINKFSKEYEDCIFLVANENVLYLREEYPNLKIFPTSKPQEDRFNVKCYPAIVHMEKNTKELKYFSYDNFKN